MKIKVRQLKRLIFETLEGHEGGTELKNIVTSGLLLRLQKNLEGRFGKVLAMELQEIAERAGNVKLPVTSEDMKSQVSDVVRKVLSPKVLENDLKDIVWDVFNAVDNGRRNVR